MRLTVKKIENDYSIEIIKQKNKYFLDNQFFKTLQELKEYLDLKIENTKTDDKQKQNKYDHFKFILLNGKALKDTAIAFLNQIYGMIDFTKIKNHHQCLSITVEEKKELITPNQYANRQKTVMRTYENKTRLGENGNARESITRIEQKTINLDRVLSIYCYAIKTDKHNKIIDKYDIICLYRKEIKQQSKILPPIHHTEKIAKINQLIHFKNDKSTIYTYKGIDYQCYLKNGQMFLAINNEKLPDPIAGFKILSIPSYEYNWHKSGSIINDRNKNLTMGKVKTLLQNKEYNSLFSYLINPYLLGYEKKLDKYGNIEKLELIFNSGKVYFERKVIQNTNIYCYPQKTNLLKFVNYYLVTLKSLDDKLECQIMDNEDILFSDIPEKQKIELREKISNLEKEQLKINCEIKKFESITISDLDHVTKKFIKDITNIENVKSLNKSNGTEYQENLKVTNVNSRLAMKNASNDKFNKVSIKKVEKLAMRFIQLLDEKNLVIDGKVYGFNYFRININRTDFKNPYKEKINIRKNQINRKILNDFNNFLLMLVMDHFSLDTNKPLIYPSSVSSIDKWLQKNNDYLEQYGIEIKEIP